jgi:hypothetical protein
VERLLEAKHLEHVPADDDVTTALKEAAFRHVASARACAGTDPEGSYALAYDAVRKAASSLLAHQALRATSGGGHIALVEAMQAQLAIASVGKLLALPQLEPEPGRRAEHTLASEHTPFRAP